MIDQPYGTHFEWRWDDADGSLFKRFQRGTQVEAWLAGIEVADNIDRMAGKQIEVAKGISKSATVVMLSFVFDVGMLDRERERIEELMRFVVSDPRRLEYAPLAELWKLSESKAIV